MINYIALAIALALSVVSGYYSIVGLATIFASAFYPVVFMGCVLEAGKLVTASWLYNNWSISPKFLKYYLIQILKLDGVTTLQLRCGVVVNIYYLTTPMP